MGKTTESRHILRLSQNKMVLDIEKNTHFHDQLLADLNNKKHLIHSLCTTEPIKRLQSFLKQQLKSEVTLLETFFTQDQDQQTVTQKQKQQCDTRLKRLLDIIKLLYKNDDFYNDDDKNLPLFNRLMTISDDFEVITKLISLLMNTSFQKTQKEFFYHIYFLCDHVDIYDLKDSGISQVYQIGKKIRDFKFYFIQENEEKKIAIEDFFKFIWENNLTLNHYKKVTDFILQKHQISLEKGSMTHLALLTKVKLYLKGVKFNSNGTVTNNGDAIVQAVAYANAMYCYVEYFVLGQEITQHCSIPNIFSFPPAYSEIFKELLEIFLLQGSHKDTHLTIMKCINEILELQEKTSAVDIVGRLNDNSSLIYKYLNYAKNYFENNQGNRSTVIKGINFEAFSTNEFISQLFKIMHTQVQETHELNNIACWIVEKIFKKETIFTYNEEVITEAGNLLVSIEYEEEKLMKLIIEKVKSHPEESKPYLRVLNDLFTKKYHRMIQRRNLTYIARQSSESCILVIMQQLIKKEVQKGISERDSFFMETIQLVSNVCEQSPTLLDSIEKTSSTLIPYLLELVASAMIVPTDINSLTDIINFLHHISLKDGPIRNTMLQKPMTTFIIKFLTMDRFVETLSRNVKSIGGYIVGSINRFIGNIKKSSKYIFNAFIQSVFLINMEYKNYSLINEIKSYDLTQQGSSIEQRVEIESEKMISILRCDSKLINLLKIIEKTSSIILKKFKSRSLYMLLRPLLEINFKRDNVFLDGSLELSLLKAIINDTISAIKNYNELTQKKDKKKLNRMSSGQQILARIQQQINQSEESSQQVQHIEQEQNRPIQRLATQNSQVIPNENQNENPPQPQPQASNDQQIQPLPIQSAQNEAINLFIRQQDSESNAPQDYQQIQQSNNHVEKKQNEMVDQNKQSLFENEEKFYTQLTQKMTQQLIQNHQTMSEQLIENLYVCFENLDKLILPILQDQNIKQTVLKQMTQYSIFQEVEKQSIQAILNNQPSLPSFSFNAVNLSITIHSSKLQRLFKFMQYSLNMDNENFNHAEFQNVIQKFNKYLRFYLEMVAESNSKNIFDFIQNSQVKYLQTSKLPRTRVQTKTIDNENLKRNLQNQLNQRWSLFNVLYDSFLRLVSGTLNGSNGKAFMILPEFQTYFQMIKQTILENVQDYLSTKILPILKTNIGIRDFQRYRQSLKVVMQIFALNELKSSLQKGKSDSNTLIILYLHCFDPSKQNILTTLSKLLAQQQQRNEQDEGFMLEDSPDNRWKQIKRIFLKMNYYKIKSFLHQAYYDDPQLQDHLLNQPDHPDYQRQLAKSYFIYQRINGLLCTFLENVIFSERKNGYLRDFLLFTTSQFAAFSQRIINHPSTIFVNFIFPDDEKKKLTETEFYSKINERNSQMINLILNNLDSSTFYYLTMTLKAVFTVQKPRDDKLLGKFNEKIKQMFYDVSKSINQVHFNLTGKNMSLDFPLPRKSSIIGQKVSNIENSQVKMEEQKEQQLDLKRQVLKVNNLFALVIEFIKNFKTNNFFEQGHPKISVNYVKSMVEFGTFILSSFEVETHFPQQGDELVISIIRMVEQFNSYRKVKDQFIKNKKTQRQKQRHLRNKKKFKHLKKRVKQFDRDSVSNSNQPEEFSASQNIPPKKGKKDNKKSQKEEKKSTKSAFKPSKRQKSEISSKQGKQTGKDKKSKAKDHQHAPVQNQAPFKGSILNRSMTDFLKISLTASQSKPYLTARTTQLIINFMQKFSKDVIIRSESDIQNIKNGKKLDKFKNKFFVFGSQIFGDLLQVKLKNQKLQGFFYLVTYLGMKLMTEPHVKIDFQCAIKRFFYQKQIRTQNILPENSKLIRLKDFENYLQKARIKDYSQFSYLLCFVERKYQSNNKDLRELMQQFIQKSTLFKKDTVNKVFSCALCQKKFMQCQFLAKHVLLKHPQLKDRLNIKPDKQNMKEQIHEFTTKNYKKFTNSVEDSQIFVKLKNPLELDVIGLPSIKRKKPAHNQDLNKKVRFYQYHPQGDFAALVCQIINNIVKIILNQIIQTLDTEKKPQEDQSLKPFNLKILLYSLQIFCRQSPTIVPWIARFKCKKILLSELKRQKLSPQSLAYKKIVSYVYGSEEVLIQSFQQVSFLTLLIKLVYPVSQISTFIFELCLDNNVLMRDKSDKSKQVKEQNENQVRKCVPFGSIIRQKIVWELQNQLTINKNIDEKFIRNGVNIKQGCLMMKKVATMGLLTILMSIREFAKLCIEGNIMRRIQDEYLCTSKIVRELCGNKNKQDLPLSSNIMRNFLINYFMRPMQMLQQLSIQYQIAKRQAPTFKRMWTNGDRVHIRFLLTSDSINDQLFGDEIFFKSNFKSTWFYANNLEGDEPLDFEDHFDQRDSIDDESSEDGLSGFWDQDDSVPQVDQQIEQEQERSVSMSGQQLVSDEQGDQQPQEWYGSEDPFDRESNTFENFILYPEDDYVLENGQQQEDQQGMQDQSQDDMDIEDQDQLDSYDDSQDEGLQQGLQIDLSSGQGNMLFPIDENSVSAIEFPLGEGQGQFYSEENIVPEVGIYRYYIPDEPQRRDHANHQCNNSNKAQIKLIETLYEIFMDVVSFEDIKITNKMVKLENQQAKLIRKVFKVVAFRAYQQKLLKSSQNKPKLHNLHILQLQNQYYEQLYQIFTIDSIFFVSEQIDFKHCERVTYFLQSFPIHYTDMYMSEPEAYFNEFTKALRRRRGMFLNSSMMDRMRRAQYQNLFSNPFRQRQIRPRGPRRVGQLRGPIQRPSRFVPGLVPLYPLSAQDIQNPNEQSPSEQSPIVQEPQQQQNQQLNLIEFNVQNPNGGVINVSTNLAEILQNMGMSERQFFSLPPDAQSDIIQNSLQSQLQNGDGNLNQYLGRIFGNDNPQAPNVSPILQPHPFEENGQNIEQEPSQQIEMPEEFDMQEENEEDEQNEQMQEQGMNQDTPINSINNNQNQEINPENDVLPQRYREISLKHSQKISKDIIETLNKDHKNDSKFPQISQQLLEQILQSIFVLENKDFSRFPEQFLTLNMINSKSCSKVLSSLMAILSLYPDDSQLNQMIEDKIYGEKLIQSKIQKGDIIPKSSLRTYLYEISKDYENEIYPNITIKILHILETITNNYSISMQMLNTNNIPLKALEKYILTQSKEEKYLSSFETLIRLLSSKTVKKSPILVDQILKITNNIVKHYFEKNIFSIHQQHKQLKGSKKNITAQNNNKIQAQGNQQISILPVSMQKQETGFKQTHKQIELSEISIELLCSLLMSDDLSDSKNLSELIMKLSINGKNLILFLKNIESVLQKLCQKSITFLNKQKKQIEKQGKTNNTNTEVEESELDDLKKFFCLLEIFSSMIKEFKQFAYRHHIDRYDFIMEKFKGIIESKSLFKLCETIASIISTTGQNNDFIKNSSQIFEIFFAVFSLNIELATKVTQDDKNLAQEKESNRIASLGQINQRQPGMKSEHLIDYTSQSLIDNVAFYRLWNQKVCSPNGRLLLNSMIKRKLFTSLKRRKQFTTMSLFDIPMVKIILNSPHLLDFENKRALFRAEMKRLKKKSGTNNVIYISLDRKEVFQQSFNIIMDKKPQDLKNRVKIDFEGQEGEDVGGLTREWYQLLSTQIFNPNYGLFRPSSTGTTYQPSSTSYVNSEHLNYFKFIGRIMGKALFDGFMLDAYFTPAFYKHILKIPITYLDMQEQDYEYFNSLKWILNNSPIEDYMELDFTYEFDNFGQIKTKELILNGANVKVTEQNKWKYVQLICYAKMATAVQSQLEKFLEGLHQVVPHKYLRIFDPKELQMMISGLPTIDINDLKRNTMLNQYLKTDQIIIWLFEVLESFDMSLRTSFLQFVTGTSKVPPQGFKGLMGLNGPTKFTIQKQFDIKSLPRAHTCFNQLDLPPYPTKETLIQKLTYAITQGKEGFGIV